MKHKIKVTMIKEIIVTEIVAPPRLYFSYSLHFARLTTQMAPLAHPWTIHNLPVTSLTTQMA
ncbi:MAG: hypothetical protein Q8840_01010, partial [Sweet potato little leaf phytoplasma]|nr:hypothetical protein [Sweet potato little leaf phytoplasma]